jgi:hypothetical protein
MSSSSTSQPQSDPDLQKSDDPAADAQRDRENYLKSVRSASDQIQQNPYVAVISKQVDRLVSDVKLASDLYALKDHPLRHYWLGAEFLVILVWAVGRSWIGTRLKDRGWGFFGRAAVRGVWSLSLGAVMVAALPYLFFGSKVWHILGRIYELGWAYLQAVQTNN